MKRKIPCKEYFTRWHETQRRKVMIKCSNKELCEVCKAVKEERENEDLS